MANQRISQFTYTSTITGDELIGVAINGQNKAISVGQILAAADESYKNAEQDKKISQININIEQQEILVRETSEKLSALQITVDDLYKQLGENNDEISSYFGSVFEDINSYVEKIQSNTNLISYFHADVMRIDKAISYIKDTLYKKNGMQDVVNQHTEQIVILHNELHDLEQNFAYKLNDINNVIQEKIDNVDNVIQEKISYINNQLDNKIDSTYAYALDYISSYSYSLDNKIDLTYTYTLGYISSSYESLYNDIVDTYSYVESSYNNAYIPLAYNIARIDSKLAELGEYGEQNNDKLDKISYISNSALSLSQENSTHISKLESDYVVADSRLDKLEADSISISQTLAYQSDAIHVLHEKVNTIEDITIPNLETKVDLANTTINDRIDKIVKLIGAANIDDSNKLTYNDIQRIANTVLGRILELEDETAHMAWHESHPETSVWGTFGIMTSCGYKSDPCISY